jgi:hypothetical protein
VQQVDLVAAETLGALLVGQGTLLRLALPREMTAVLVVRAPRPLVLVAVVAQVRWVATALVRLLGEAVPVETELNLR